MDILTEEQSKALQLDRHISLTANAGSGKTFVLSKRFIEIALLPNITLQNICAITFTDKAANELYKKISSEIDQRIFDEQDLRLKTKLQFIRRQLVSANISTIHSFCINILREHPVESGIDANFTPIDQSISDELIELAIQDVFKTKFSEVEEQNLKYLIRTFSSKNILQNEITSLIKNRKNVLEIKQRLYSQDESATAQYLTKIFDQKVNEIFLTKLQTIIGIVENINNAVLNIKKDNQKAIIINSLLNKIKKEKSNSNIKLDLQSLLNEITTEKGEVYKRGYLKDQSDYETEIQYIQEFAADYCKLDIVDDPKLNLSLAQFGNKLFQFFDKCLLNYSNKKLEQGLLDFEDILLCTKELLEKETVQQSLADKYKYVMIDEYQDTNELQYNIFLPIVDHLRKNNLFVVGDEKQSIYMFRDAELEVFDKTKNDIKNRDGEESLLELPHSFRMAPIIAAFTNELFSRLFNSPDINFNEVAYNEIICSRESNVEGKIEVLFAQNQNNEKHSVSQGDLLRDKLIQLSTAENFKWGDCAILVRKRKSFSDLWKIFLESKIPFTILSGKGFFQQQIVSDVYNYFSFLLDQKNDAALVGILRSPFFLLSDSELFDISCSKGNSFFEKMKSFAVNHDHINEILSNINIAISLVYNHSVPEILSYILSQSFFISVINSRVSSEQDKANIKKLITLTLEYHSRGFTTLYDYINFLEAKMDDDRDESQAVLNDESNSVKILTIHQSKGLEFKNVFLYRCDDSGKKNVTKTKSITLSKEFGVITKLFQKENYFAEAIAPPIASLNNIIVDRKNIAELKRLFYVAVTRAQDSLFICCESPSKNKNTFIGLLQNVFGFIEEREKLRLNSSLKKAVIQNDKIITQTIDVRYDIPITRQIEIGNNASFIKETLPKKSLEIDLSLVNAKSTGESLSASKLLTFKQCPFKYYLKYEVGYDTLIDKSTSLTILNDVNSEINDGDNFNDEKNILNELHKNSVIAKGRIIHKLLQMNLLPEQIVPKIEEAIAKEMHSDLPYKSLNEEIESMLKSYYASECYSKLSKYSVFKNEFEIYLKEDDYFLNGVVDKIIYDGNKILLIDYKTDNVNENNIQERSEHYFNQLKFYFYIVSGLYNYIDHFELQLIFLANPEKYFLMKYSQKDRLIVGKEINYFIENLKNKSFSKNRMHCFDCNYSIGLRKCIHD